MLENYFDAIVDVSRQSCCGHKLISIACFESGCDDYDALYMFHSEQVTLQIVRYYSLYTYLLKIDL